MRNTSWSPAISRVATSLGSGPHQRRAVLAAFGIGQRQHRERPAGEEVLLAPPLVRLGVRHRRDDSCLPVLVPDSGDAGDIAKLRAHAVGRDQQPR